MNTIYKKICNIIDDCLVSDFDGAYHFNQEYFETALQEYAGVRIQHSDNLDFLYGSLEDDIRSSIGRMIYFSSVDNEEDVKCLLSQAACEYFRDEFLEKIQERCEYMELQDKLDAGLLQHVHSDNGEAHWIGGAM